MSSIIGADLESYTYSQRCRILVLLCCILTFSSSRIIVLSHYRPLALPFLTSVCYTVVLSHGHSLGFFNSHSILSDSHPLALPFLTSFCRMVVLSDSRILTASSQILEFLSSCPLVPHVILLHGRPLALSSSCIVVLLHCRHLALSSSRIVVISHCRSL